MKKMFFIFIILIFLILSFSACVYKGTNNISLFIEKYNALSEKEYQIDILDAQITSEDGANFFGIFIDENTLMKVEEDSSSGNLISCSICCSLNSDYTVSLFNSLAKKMFLCFCDINEKEASDIITSLAIDDSSSYSQNTKQDYTFSIYNFNFLTNSTGIFISVEFEE